MTRDELTAEYFRLTRDVLPARGRVGKWVAEYDHCFQRILLDYVCGGPWRMMLTGRNPAHRQLSDEQLAAAVTLARRIEAEGDDLLRDLNRQSLRWRGKRQC